MIHAAAAWFTSSRLRPGATLRFGLASFCYVIDEIAEDKM
jgi:hypothetical protein